MSDRETLASRTATRFGKLMGVDIHGPLDMVHLTHKRVSAIIVHDLIEAGIPKQDLLRFVPKSALVRCEQRHQLLPLEATDRLVRFIKVQALAAEVLGSVENAVIWLQKPRRMFDGMSGLEMVQSTVGAQLVEETLGQLDEGYFA